MTGPSGSIEGVTIVNVDTSSPKITISDVAQAAGVAQSTVSLVLNHRGRVSAATRQRVRQVMDDLGYEPRRNVTRPNRHVAVVYGGEMIFCTQLVRYCREWIGGIREHLGQSESTDISIFCGQSHVTQDPIFQATLQSGELDGVILMGVYQHDGYLQEALQTKLPTVMLNNLPQATEFSSVCVDYSSSARSVLSHLANLGHRRIATFFRRNSTIWETIHRSLASEAKARELELFSPDEHLAPSFDDLGFFDHVASELRQAGVTAAYSGDPFAYRLGNALQNQGVRIPQDFSLVGFDNLGMSLDNGQRLASVDYDTQEMGRLAGKILGDHWQRPGNLSSCVIHVPTRLHIGQTTGPCPPCSADSQRASTPQAAASLSLSKPGRARRQSRQPARPRVLSWS